MLNILVTGSNGQLGSHIRLLGAKSAHRYIYTDVAELDITDVTAIQHIVDKESIDVVINCAAYTDVEAAESNYETAKRINTDAVRNLAEVMHKTGGLLVHISTDYIFNGTGNTPYTEDAPANPLNAYGTTKLSGEKAIAETGCHHIIIRTSWLYGEYGKNFVKTMLSLMATKPRLKVVADQTGTPTYAGDLAAAVAGIVESGKWRNNEGTYNYSNEGMCSWFDFAEAIAEEAGNTLCDIEPCRSDEFPSKVHRPAYSVLDKAKIKATFGIAIPHWTDSLKVCINNLKK